MKENLKMMKLMEKDIKSGKMVKNIKVILLMEKRKEKVKKNGLMDKHMKEGSNLDIDMVKGSVNFQEEQNILEILIWVNMKEKGNLYGKMVLNIKENLKIIKLKEKENISGKMGMNMKVILSMENLKDMELRKKMEKYIKDILKMIYTKEKVKKVILMVKNMKGIFMKVYLMVMEHGFTAIKVKWKQFGKKVKKMEKQKKLWKMEILLK